MLWHRKTILLIGGSAEARALAARLRGQAVVMLPVPERQPQPWPLPQAPQAMDLAGLGERASMGVRLIVDASHPCDRQTSQLAARVAAAQGLDLLRLERPPWRPGRRDHWLSLRAAGAAARHVARGSRVFLATGREEMQAFANLRDAYVITRQRTAHHDAFPLPRGRFLPGAAPFTVAGEAALFRLLRIDWLILRNAGGPGGWPKLAAARRLGLRVGMIARPVLPPAPVVRDVAAAERWIAAWQG